MSNGLFLKNRGDLEAARRTYEKCSAESRETSDRVHTMKANHGLAAVAVLQHDYASAEKFLSESLVLSRESGEDVQTAHALCALGDLEMCRGDIPAARPLLEECRELSKKLGDGRILTTVFYNLGTIDHHECSYGAAAGNFAESLRIAEKMGNKTMIACALDGAGALAAGFEEYESAARLAGGADALREEIGCQIEPAEETFRENYLAKTRAALGEKETQIFYTLGRAINMDEAITLAKSVLCSSDFTETEIITEKHTFTRIVIEETTSKR
jgi:tetratricopeptide (TPR) repeat protein